MWPARVSRVTLLRNKVVLLLSAFTIAVSLTAVITSSGHAARIPDQVPAETYSPGYWLARSNGLVTPFGAATSYASDGGKLERSEVVGMVSLRDSSGYWLVTADGTVLPRGEATSYGSMTGQYLTKPIVGIAATPTGRGYWLVGADGGVFSFGDAKFYGSTGAERLARPMAGIAATPDGAGYWLVAQDGGVFAFGDAGYYGSAASTHLTSDIVAMATTPDGHGYWLVTAAGEVLPFGNTRFYGSLDTQPAYPIVSVAAAPDGGGYWLASRDGVVYSFGDAQSLGSTGPAPLPHGTDTVSAIVASPRDEHAPTAVAATSSSVATIAQTTATTLTSGETIPLSTVDDDPAASSNTASRALPSSGGSSAIDSLVSPSSSPTTQLTTTPTATTSTTTAPSITTTPTTTTSTTTALSTTTPPATTTTSSSSSGLAGVDGTSLPLEVEPQGTVALGVAVNDPGKPAALDSYVSAVGRNPAIVEWYQSWSEPLYYSSQEATVKALGATPLITWDPTFDGQGIPLSAIVAGTYDQYLRSAAQQAIAWGGPIMVRFAHEMNLAGSPYGPGQNGNTPALFIAAWRHVVTVFRQQGATNVSWVWSPNVNCGGSCPFQAFYPGDQWVDWVGLDGYNYASVDDVPWMTFQQVFGSSYAELTALTSKPLMIAETASTELGGSKATWIEQTFAQIPTSFPHIKAIVWFDIDKETDWPVNSSPTSLAAYRQVVTSPNYRGTLAVG